MYAGRQAGVCAYACTRVYAWPGGIKKKRQRVRKCANVPIFIKKYKSMLERSKSPIILSTSPEERPRRRETETAKTQKPKLETHTMTSKSKTAPTAIEQAARESGRVFGLPKRADKAETPKTAAAAASKPEISVERQKALTIKIKLLAPVVNALMAKIKLALGRAHALPSYKGTQPILETAAKHCPKLLKYYNTYASKQKALKDELNKIASDIRLSAAMDIAAMADTIADTSDVETYDIEA